MKRVTDAKHAQSFDSIVKIKHKPPETRLSPHLIYLLRPEQMHVELTENTLMHMVVPVVATNFARNLA